MEALRAAIEAAQSAGELLLAQLRPYCGEGFVWERLSELKDVTKICDRIELDPVLGRDRDTEASLKQCADNVSDIKVLLEEANSFRKNQRFRQPWKSLVREDIEEESVRLFNRLQRERAALELHIATATSDAEYQMGVAATGARRRFAAFSPADVNFLRDEIFITDPRDDRSSLISAKGERADGTCMWVLETDAYNAWMNTPCPGLWITGGPGTGKTMMSIFLTEQLELKAARSEAENVIYYFCDNQNDSRNDALGILRGLIWQLGSMKPSLMKHGLSDVRLVDANPLFYLRMFDLRMEILCRIFNNMVEDLDAGCVFCVIDGLDECDSTSSDLVNCLLGVSTSKFKPLVLSRPLNQPLTRSLSNYLRLRLDTDLQKEIKADLKAFIQQRVQQLSDDGGYPPALQQVIHDTFIQRSEGTFLWVKLAAQELEKRPLAEVETCLSSLPSGLDGIYSRILRSIDHACAGSVSRLLTVITTAYRPLSIEDAETLLGIQPVGQLTASEVMESVVAQCSSLLVLVCKPRSEKKVIRLLHQSVKDYLFRSSKYGDRGLEAFYFQHNKAHLQLASLCLGILESHYPENFRTTRDRSFTGKYAVDCFKHHAKDSGSEFSSLVPRFLFFLVPLMDAAEDMVDWRSSIHNASHFGVLPIVRHVLDKPLGLYKSIRGYTQGMTPLHIAAFWENDEVVRVLLEKQRRLPRKWSASSTNSAGETPLHIAAGRRPVSSVQALLDYKSDPNIRNNQGHTPLHKAIYMDHAESVRLLLAAGAQASAQDFCGRTPLYLAAAFDLKHGAHSGRFCHPSTDSVMKQLLEAGSDVDRGDEYGILPLHIAVLRSCARHTRLLLHWSANPAIANYWGFKPLHYIVGDSEILASIDEYRANDRYSNSRKGNIFSQSSGNRNVSTANFPHGNYSIYEGWGDARGRLAVSEHRTYVFMHEEQHNAGVKEILECFKSSGADLNVQAADGTTPLMCCAYRNKPTCLVAAKWLIAAGVDVNTQDDHGDSCLHIAVVQRKRSLVAALIDAGANQELQNEKGMTPADLIQLRPEFWEVLETEVKVEEVE
ncbi:hypothetical protein GCG54_00000645 [Colletotrichum gloeosporioides]|uniref:Nephrocystin 3-like N-terminal domain-containing protein n=1 Tax=Colletotrichum gloeosporioides TaxID=474922 RepID=A0A8H4CI73_COLGL|nr:uncharacterized protein GCG54_00000645 [Colletotrichum gloeosporioides]KAF3804294.1 hypothetical protein GCG54_00000645 [Colletotrichum gloeosporioides]